MHVRGMTNRGLRGTLSAALGCTLAGVGLLLGAPGAAYASPSRADARSTRAYLVAYERLLRAQIANLGQGQSALSTVITQTARECPGVLAQAPQGQELNEVSMEIGAALGVAVTTPNRPAISTFLASTRSLRWSSDGVAGAVSIFETKEAVIAAMTSPNLCGDLRSWAASGFTQLPEAARDLNAEGQLLSFPTSQILDEFERHENPRLKPLVRQARKLEARLSAKGEPFIQRAAMELATALSGHA